MAAYQRILAGSVAMPTLRADRVARWSADHAGPADQLTVPAKRRRWSQHEDRPPIAREQLRQCGQDNAITGVESDRRPTMPRIRRRTISANVRTTTAADATSHHRYSQPRADVAPLRHPSAASLADDAPGRRGPSRAQ